MPGMDLLVIYANKQVMEFYVERGLMHIKAFYWIGRNL